MDVKGDIISGGMEEEGCDFVFYSELTLGIVSRGRPTFGITIGF